MKQKCKNQHFASEMRAFKVTAVFLTSSGMDYNFKKQRSDNIDSLNVAYDYKSVMHYGKTAFGNGRVTIKTINPAMQDVIGQRAGFSGLDIKQMNLLYKCSGRVDINLL